MRFYSRLFLLFSACFLVCGVQAYGQCFLEDRECVASGVESVVSDCEMCDGMWYRLHESDRTAVLLPAVEGMYDFVSVDIPESVRGSDGCVYRVVGISDGAFKGCERLTSVRVPSSVETVGKDVFAGCISMSLLRFERCDVPLVIEGSLFSVVQDVASLPEMHFYCGRTLETRERILRYTNTVSCELDGIRELTDKYVASCITLRRIRLHSGLVSLQAGAFTGCRSLVSLELPEGVTSMVWGVFDNCESLESVSLPSTLETLEPFYDSCSLRDIYCGAPEPPVLIGSSRYPYADGATGVVHVPAGTGDAYSSWASERFVVVDDYQGPSQEYDQVLTLRVTGGGRLTVRSADGEDLCAGDADSASSGLEVIVPFDVKDLVVCATPDAGNDVGCLRILDCEGNDMAVSIGTRGRSLFASFKADMASEVHAVFEPENARMLHILMPLEETPRLTLDLPEGGLYRFVYTPAQGYRLHSAILGDTLLEITEEQGKCIVEVPDYDGERVLRLVEQASSVSVARTEPTVPGIRITSSQGGVVVSGLVDGETVYVYTVDGHMAACGKADGGVCRIPDGISGIHVVCAGDMSLKVHI